MKKFIVLSTLVAIAGLAVGLAGRSGSAAQTVETAAPTSTTITTAAPELVTTSTTGPKAATSKATTATTVRRIVTPIPTTAPVVAVTTSTTAQPVNTTTAPAATMPTTPVPVATCTAVAAKPVAVRLDPQTITVTSNKSKTLATIVMLYTYDNGGPYKISYQGRTDAAGGLSWTFQVHMASARPVQVRVELPGGPEPTCSTTFDATVRS